MFQSSGYFTLSSLLLTISIHVSAALSHNIAADAPLRCANKNGIEPYKAIGLSVSYSNTSKLYNRYGSLYAPSPPLKEYKINKYYII
jgi:hypothetical protein